MNQDRTINVMDKMWDRKSEVIGRCGGDEKTRMTTQNRQESIMIFIDQQKQPAYTLQGIYI